MSSENNKNLLDQVNDVMGVKHYSIQAERTYRDRIRGYVKFRHGIYQKIREVVTSEDIMWTRARIYGRSRH